MARPIAREAAMQLIFEQIFGGEGETQTLVDLIDYQPDDKDQAYIDDVVKGVHAHEAELDAEITACLRGWTIARLSRVNLAILRLAVYEIVFEDTVDTAVAINEAVELAKKYAGEEEAGFVNGLLGSFVRSEDFALIAAEAVADGDAQ